MRRVLFAFVIVSSACKPRHHAPPPIPETISEGAWSLEPLPVEDAQVQAVGGSSEKDVWAVGRETIFHYDGATWSDATPASFRGSRATLRSISVVAKDDAWAVGDNGNIAHYDGKSWTITQPALLQKKGFKDTYEDLTHVVAWPSEVVANVSFGGGLIRYDTVTWNRLSWPNEHVVIDDFWGTSSHDLWLPGRSAQHFDGDKWAEAKAFGMLEDMYATGGSGPNDVWMVGGTGSRSSTGRARHFDGTSWKDVPLPRTSTLHAICVVSPSEAYAVGLLDSVIAWDGASWHALALPAKASGSFTSVYSPGGGVMFASSPQSRYVLHKKATPIARDAAL